MQLMLLAGCATEARQAFVDGVPAGTIGTVATDAATGNYVGAIVAGLTALAGGIGGYITYRIKTRNKAE